MKRVVSISLGSSRRNKKVRARFFGEEFEIERIGTDGDMARFAAMVSDLDGKVDAFGVGGSDITVRAAGHSYVFREILALMKGARQTPYVDGSGLKNTLERETVGWLEAKGLCDFANARTLMVCAVDRFGMAEAIAARCPRVVYGDLMFGLGVPIAIRSWTTIQRLAAMLLPIIVRLPFKWLYPTGDKQNVNTPKFTRYFDKADIIAGDFLMIKRYMPAALPGKTILTNTTTAEDVDELRRRGVARVVTTTPVLDGRSFGTNVMEAVLVTVIGRKPEEITDAEYLQRLKDLGWEPNVQDLAPATVSAAS